MVDDWSNVTVEEIKSSKAHAMAMGPFGSDIKSDNFVPFGVPIIRGVNLGAERFNDDDFVFLTEQKADELHGANAYPGDIIFTHRGTLGQVGIIPGNARYPRYVVSQSQMKLSCDTNKVDPLFVFYYFRSPFGQYALLANTSTTGVPAIARPLTTLKSIQLPLPPISEQHAIADFISSLDDKIELNHQMNETLEAMASAIFKSWFVDYDPVRAKMEDRTPLGMNAETAAMFPSSFENSAIGKIPTGWKVASIGEIIEFAYGKALKEEARYSGSIPVYGSNGQVGWHNEALVKGPGIVVGRKGNPGIVTWVAKDFFPIDTTFYVVPKGPIHAMHYIYYALSLQNLASLAADSAVPGLNRNIAYMTEILVPSVEIADIFDKTVEPFFNRVSMNNEESRTLAAIRDALLPKLLSGEIRVKDTEKYAEALP